MSRWRRSRRSKQPEPTAAPETSTVSPASQTLVIGQWMTVKGDVSAECDVRIDGTVEGSVEIPENKLTVAVSGRVTANVRAHSVIVRGLVVGDIVAADRVEILPAGSVCGKIRARRVVLAEGSQVNGDVNMGPADARSAQPAQPVQRAQPTQPARPARSARLAQRAPAPVPAAAAAAIPAKGQSKPSPAKRPAGKTEAGDVLRDRFGRPFPMWTMVESGDA